VLFWRAIQLSVSSEHWGEVNLRACKAWGADPPKSPVMLNPQPCGAPEPIDVFIPVSSWSDGSSARVM